MKLEVKGAGAERKKVLILGGLGLVLAYTFYTNVIAPSDDIPRSTPAATRAPGPTPAAITAAPAPETRPQPPLRPGGQSTRPEFKMGSRDKRPDPTTIDPTLRLDLLGKVQSVNLEGGERNLFQFGAAPPPKAAPLPKIIPQQAQAAAANSTPEPAAPPPPPPIPLKFYGYANQVRAGEKRAFFLDGEDIVVATEGETIKSRYKVVRIGINSVVVEDVQFQHQQTLALEEQAG